MKLWQHAKYWSWNGVNIHCYKPERKKDLFRIYTSQYSFKHVDIPVNLSHYQASTRLKYQRFENRLHDKPLVKTLICLSLVKGIEIVLADKTKSPPQKKKKNC